MKRTIGNIKLPYSLLPHYTQSACVKVFLISFPYDFRIKIIFILSSRALKNEKVLEDEYKAVRVGIKSDVS